MCMERVSNQFMEETKVTIVLIKHRSERVKENPLAGKLLLIVRLRDEKTMSLEESKGDI